MATATPIAYNPSLSPISGTQQIGLFATGFPTSGFTGSPKWWNSPDLEPGYVVGIPVSGNTQPTPISGVTASLGFYRSSALTETAFVSLGNYLTGQSFGDGNDASVYMEETLGYYTSWTGSPTNQFITSSASTASNTTYSFGGIDIGGPGLIVLTLGIKRAIPELSNYDVVSSIVVNGLNATIHTERGYNENGSAIASVRITGNTTIANIDVNLPYTGDALTLNVYRVQNNISDTPLDTRNSYLAVVEFGDSYTFFFSSPNPKVTINTCCSTATPSSTVSMFNLTKNSQVNNAEMLMASGSKRIPDGSTSYQVGFEFDSDASFASSCGAIWN